MFPIKTKWIISLTAWLIAWACLVSAEEKIIRGERIRAFLKNGELNLMGDFPEPKWSVLEERNLIKNGRWHPGIRTWHMIYGGNVVSVDDFESFLGTIKHQRPGSVKRINLFSHGGPGLIALSGSINPRTGDVELDTKSSLNERIAQTDPIPIGLGKEQEALGTIARTFRNRFSKGAEIVFYLCNSGADSGLLQKIADAFQVVVKGFRDQLLYCPVWELPAMSPTTKWQQIVITNRRLTGYPTCANKKPGFRHLVPDVVAGGEAGRQRQSP